MNCKEVRDRLSDFEDGSLPETSENEIRCHLQGCADCSDVARSLEMVREGLRQLPPVSAPPELLEKIRETISRETSLPDTAAIKDNAIVELRPGSRWKFPLGAAAAILLFASIGWHIAGGMPGKTTKQEELQAESIPALSETAVITPQSEPTPVATLQDSAGIQRTRAVPASQALAQTAQAPPRAASPESLSFARLETRENQSEERSIATLPEDISDPQIRVYSLADLPASPVLRASTRFARIQPYAPEADSAPHETQMPESEAQDSESQTTRLRPPAPYGREISAEVASEKREEALDRIASTVKRLGGTVEEVDRDAPEGTITVRV
ncbi:MAG: zf-HC2 domain-containing protein, partial [Syntrophorhabdaceae bacterium]|nr:zf-HC2 domain-containing protein [Syntrophorhabdaceae bacterium]